jgi:hypothetical protein
MNKQVTTWPAAPRNLAPWTSALWICCVALLSAIGEPRDGQAAFVNFINGGDFNSAANWDDGNVPTNDFDQHFVQDDLTATFTSGETAVFLLAVGDTSTGRLDISGGNLKVTGSDRFEVGRSAGGSGEVNLTDSAILTTDGAVVGTRSVGVVRIGPNALFDLKDADVTDRDIRIGSFGPNFNPALEPDLDGDGLVVVQGTLDGSSAIISQSGARGELRLEGGTIDLVNRLWMNLCEGCASTAGRSAKVSIVGSTGTFLVGGGDILADVPTAIFSFTADQNGVTPIVVNSGAEINTATLELDLDAFAFTSTSTLTLIDAIPTLLSGQFGTVTFLGNTTADVNYDTFNGDVFLSSFQSSAIAGDFDGDGDVDGDDLTGTPLGWQSRFGSDLTGGDFLAWQRNLGSGTSLATAVPEPGTWASTLAALTGWLMSCACWPSRRPTRRRLGWSL